MKIIKLSAIDSTNSFLKEMASSSTVENFTVVVTENQIKGRGQQGSTWESEVGKNLIFSVFVVFDALNVLDKKYLSYAVSLAVFEVLQQENIPRIAIKWPNDILSANKKIGGILIENSLKGSKISSSVIGIGLNVNQTRFSSTLEKASSLKLTSNRTFNLEQLLEDMVVSLQSKIALLNTKDFSSLESSYLRVLYKKNTPTMFKDRKGALFMGIIRGISMDGKLQVELEDEMLREFGIKEISLL
ncbi:MAG: BirA family biotin operon repressor/biotin-[acetyl-CoA-carboxylase] ligase [Arenicella sp.]